MRIFVATIAAIGLFSTVAMAQDAPAAQSGPSNAAVKSVTENNSNAPVAGANSFTKGQAKSQIEAKGYTHVKGLKKDEHGVWRGTALKDGVSSPVSVDFQGNVN